MFTPDEHELLEVRACCEPQDFDFFGCEPKDVYKFWCEPQQKSLDLNMLKFSGCELQENGIFWV